MLNINPNKDDRPIVSRMKKLLIGKFRPNSENDIDLAIRLSHYLMVLGKLDESKLLLNSFLYFDQSEKGENYQHLWYSNCYGILLLAMVELALGNKKRSSELCAIVEGGDYFHTDEEDHYYIELKDLKDDYEFHIKDYLNETHKFRCQVISQLYINFLFFSMLPNLTLGYDSELMKSESADIKAKMDILNGLLKDQLENRK